MEEIMKNNQLTVSEIDTITTEIIKLKNQTAQNIIEMGKRLTKVKESLPHGEFGKYLSDKVDFTDRTARRFMQVAKEFGNRSSLSVLGASKLVALLDVPTEKRDKFISDKHEVAGQTKTVKEMSTRELQKVIKENKESNVPEHEEIEENTYTLDDLEELKKQRDNILSKRHEILSENTKQYQEINKKIDKVCDELGSYDQLEFTITLAELLANTEGFLQQYLAGFLYDRSLTHLDNPIVAKNLLDMIHLVDGWSEEMKSKFPQKYRNETIIDAEIIE